MDQDNLQHVTSEDVQHVDVLPSFLNPGTMSTNVATPVLSGEGRWALKRWPSVRRW